MIEVHKPVSNRLSVKTVLVVCLAVFFVFLLLFYAAASWGNKKSAENALEEIEKKSAEIAREMESAESSLGEIKKLKQNSLKGRADALKETEMSVESAGRSKEVLEVEDELRAASQSEKEIEQRRKRIERIIAEGEEKLKQAESWAGKVNESYENILGMEGQINHIAGVLKAADYAENRGVFFKRVMHGRLLASKELTQAVKESANARRESAKALKIVEEVYYEIAEMEDILAGLRQSERVTGQAGEEAGKAKKEAKAKASIVWVKYDVEGKNVDGHYFSRSSTGSGVIVSNAGGVLEIYTNRHVVDCERSDIVCFQRISEAVKVKTQDGLLHDVDRVSFSSSDADLAILSVDIPNSGKYSFVSYNDSFRVGDRVNAIGYPSYAKNAVEFSVGRGRITGIKNLISQSTGDRFRVIESDAYTSFGSSGGGLFDEQGALIGINTWKDQEKTSIAIDFNSIEGKNFDYCRPGSYWADGRCHEYCGRDEVMGQSRECYGICLGFYCDSKKPKTVDERCERKGYIFGRDGACHPACGSENSYCSPNSVCFKDECYSRCSQGYLWEDGSCRFR